MEKFFKLFALFVFVISVSSNASANPELKKKVEDYLNGLTTVQADFIQTTENGNSATGKFYLKRPERMRFEYAPPVPVVMVSTGLTITYHDTQLDQITTIPISDSIAGFIGRKQIDLDDKKIKITSFKQEDGIIKLNMHMRGRKDEGSLLMEFTSSPISLFAMTTTDSGGKKTRINFINAQYGINLASSLFQPPRKSIFRKRGPGAQ